MVSAIVEHGIDFVIRVGMVCSIEGGKRFFESTAGVIGERKVVIDEVGF